MNMRQKNSGLGCSLGPRSATCKVGEEGAMQCVCMPGACAVCPSTWRLGGCKNVP
jgi:hypothetical protein